MKKNKTVIKLAKNVRNYKLILHIKAKKKSHYTHFYIHTFKKKCLQLHMKFFLLKIHLKTLKNL